MVVGSLVLGIFLLNKPSALPTSDLMSPSQEVRDAAAKVLRVKAKPSSKLKWALFSVRLKFCKTKSDVLELLKTYGVSTNPVGGVGSIAEYLDYQLDDYWVLTCGFDTNPEHLFFNWKLSPRWRSYFVRPSTNFTGIWINYFANGQKNSEEHLLNGQRHGEHTTYYPDGQKGSVWHYDNGKLNGMRASYFNDGQIQGQDFYSNQMRVGESVRFHTNGSLLWRENYINGQRNGPFIIYFPSGKIRTSIQYTNGEKVGFEITYNEDGTTNSVVDHSNK